MGGLFRPHNDLVNMFKTLCDGHSDKARYQSIGKTREGRDIWLFKLGNPNGGAVLFDGCLHGWEDMGSEVEYLYAQWLLESGALIAEKILRENYTLIIPVINMDSTERQNRNFTDCQYGVDLNRNFAYGWTANTCNDYDYHGKSARSEKETQVGHSVFETFKPKQYVNTHYGGGPYLAYHSTVPSSTIQPILNRINQLSTEKSVTPYDYRSTSGRPGYAIGDAYVAGAVAWLLETASGPGCYMHTEHSYQDIVNIFFPKILPILIAVSEACAIVQPPPPPVKYTFTNWQDGDVNPTKTIVVS